MRLYPRGDATSVQHDDHGSFDVDPDTGSIEVPDELGSSLQALHIDGEPAFETETERDKRLKIADLDRRRDPASLYDAFADLASRSRQAPATEPATVPEPEPVTVPELEQEPVAGDGDLEPVGDGLTGTTDDGDGKGGAKSGGRGSKSQS